MVEQAVTTEEEMLGRLILAALRKEGVEGIGEGDYHRGSHDRFVHAFLPCSRTTSMIYSLGEIPLEQTMFKKCPVCWGAVDRMNNEAATK